MSECEIEVNGQEGMTMAEEMVRKQSKKIPNSRTCGRNSVQGFWLKTLVQLHKKKIQKSWNDVFNGS